MHIDVFYTIEYKYAGDCLFKISMIYEICIYIVGNDNKEHLNLNHEFLNYDESRI